jgi:hypothetical protein
MLAVAILLFLVLTFVAAVIAGVEMLPATAMTVAMMVALVLSRRRAGS